MLYKSVLLVYSRPYILYHSLLFNTLQHPLSHGSWYTYVFSSAPPKVTPCRSLRHIIIIAEAAEAFTPLDTSTYTSELTPES